MKEDVLIPDGAHPQARQTAPSAYSLSSITSVTVAGHSYPALPPCSSAEEQLPRCSALEEWMTWQPGPKPCVHTSYTFVMNELFAL